MSFYTPKLYGQIKLNKENHPIRPVTAAYSDPSFSLAKFLNNWFRTYTNFKPRFTIHNSLELWQHCNICCDIHVKCRTTLLK